LAVYAIAFYKNRAFVYTQKNMMGNVTSIIANILKCALPATTMKKWTE
jgi:hypothetical protein